MAQGARALEIRAWAAKRSWPSSRIAVEYQVHLPLEQRLPAWAECAGPDDPACGRARFSVHGCNDGGPSRAEYVVAMR